MCSFTKLITARFLKECAEVIADNFVQLFNASLKQGKVPDDWKKGTVTPIYKGGNKPRSAAERPISLTSITCKIMEHVLFSHIITHLEKEGTLNVSVMVSVNNVPVRHNF